VPTALYHYGMCECVWIILAPHIWRCVFEFWRQIFEFQRHILCLPRFIITACVSVCEYIYVYWLFKIATADLWEDSSIAIRHAVSHHVSVRVCFIHIYNHIYIYIYIYIYTKYLYLLCKMAAKMATELTFEKIYLSRFIMLSVTTSGCVYVWYIYTYIYMIHIYIYIYKYICIHTKFVYRLCKMETKLTFETVYLPRCIMPAVTTSVCVCIIHIYIHIQMCVCLINIYIHIYMYTRTPNS